jgi:signal transduction histidine kinase
MDITVDRQQAAARRRPRRVPWSPRAWSQAFYLASGIPVQILLAAGLVSLTAMTVQIGTHHGSGSALIVAWLLALTAIFALSPVLTWVQRHRLRATAGVEIPPQPKRRGTFWVRFALLVQSPATWRRLSYHLLAAPLLAVAAAVAVGAWLAGLFYGLCYCYAWALGDGSMLYRATYGSTARHHPFGIALMVAGIASLFAAPWLSAAVASADERAARALLGPSRADELEHRVQQLTKTRAGVVDAADAERRRLERDLHDGTQQRLVSLALNLGMARAQAGTPDEARQAIADAHEEAKAALAELRDLIRGLHPAVLEDRGLDAALSGVAARMPIPVRLTVDLPRRPAPVIEAVAYFVVSEGLANIAKHSQASEAAVFVQRAGDRLHVIVTDDGVGGADQARGTGLAGLARRAASVDGTFEIDSPPGGPTLLTVDLPCNR